MKKIFLAATISFFSITGFAQARIATAEYNKTMQPGIEVDVPFEEKTVMKSLVDKLEKKGYRGKENKGYTIFKGVTMSELGPGSYDLYFKTDRKSRKEKDASVLTMLISKGGDTFVGESDDAALYTGAKSFLNSHIVTATAYDLELQIQEQTEITEKANKKYDNLVDDGKDLVKKKEKVEKDIEENLKKQEDQKAEVEKQRQILNTLTGKRRQ